MTAHAKEEIGRLIVRGQLFPHDRAGEAAVVAVLGHLVAAVGRQWVVIFAAAQGTAPAKPAPAKTPKLDKPAARRLETGG